MKTLEFMAKYRTGIGYITCRTTVSVKAVLYVQEIPMETPEYQDGMVSTIATVMGERLYSTESYEDLSARYNEQIKDEA